MAWLCAAVFLNAGAVIVKLCFQEINIHISENLIQHI
jgi:hypothetical protein